MLIKPSIRFGVTLGLATGAASACVFTLWDWLENPGGIFRGEQGTQWFIVLDTVASWFIPTFIALGCLGALAHFVWTYFRYRQKHQTQGSQPHKKQFDQQ